MQGDWTLSASDEYFQQSEKTLKYGLIRLLSWPDLAKVPEALQPLVARICALLSRKPSAGNMMPLVLSAPEGEVMRVIATLAHLGHIGLASSVYKESSAVESPAPEMPLSSSVEAESRPRFGFARRSLVAKLWQKFVS